MGRRLARWIWCGLVAAWAVGGAARVTAEPAVGDPAAVPVEYQADAGCPSRERFVALVQAAREAPDESGVAETATLPRVRVEIRAAGAAYRGTMETVDHGASSEPRVIAGPRCDEVAQALALTVAFSLSAATDAANAAPGPVTVASPARGMAAMALAPPTSVRVVSSVAVAPAARAPAAPWRWLVGLGASAGGWLAPDTMAGIDAGAALRSPSEVGPLALGWGVRARVSYARNDWRGDDPVARFGLLAGALDLCGNGRPARGPVELGLCAGVEVGWLRGRGVRVAMPRASDWPWLAVGGGPSLRLPLGGRWQIEVRGVVERPLRRVRFSFEQPEQSVAQTRALVGIGVLALVARLP
ncbi:MAG TPA: hypothetical protein VFH68_22760 [Polyangia bacterium]|jgi:hypothetical protein|nr:hypothetical protein [Polyangia bacterium]